LIKFLYDDESEIWMEMDSDKIYSSGLKVNNVKNEEIELFKAFENGLI